MREFIVELAADMDNHNLGVFQTTVESDRTIFVGEMIEDTTEGLLLVQVPGPPPHSYVDTEYQIIDIWARSPHTDRAYSLLREVYNLYNRRYDYDYSNWHVYFSLALGSIIDVDRDIESSKLLRLSVQFITRNLNNVS